MSIRAMIGPSLVADHSLGEAFFIGVGSFDHSQIDILASAPPEHRKPIRLSCFWR
jgi:hypothetical protein